MKFEEWKARQKDPEFASWSSEKIVCEFRGGPSGPAEIEKLFCLKSFMSALEEKAPSHLEGCKGCVQGSEIAGEYREKFGKLPDPKARKRQPADVGAIIKKIEAKEEKMKGKKKFKCDKCGRTFSRPQALGRHRNRCEGPVAEKPKRKYVRREAAAVKPGRPGAEKVAIFSDEGIIIISNQEKPVEALIRARDAIEARLREELGV